MVRLRIVVGVVQPLVETRACPEKLPVGGPNQKPRRRAHPRQRVRQRRRRRHQKRVVQPLVGPRGNLQASPAQEEPILDQPAAQVREAEEAPPEVTSPTGGGVRGE